MMKNQSKSEELQNAIMELHTQRDQQLVDLKAQFQTSYQSLKPINLIKSTVKEITQSDELKGNLATSLMGISAGYLAKKLLVGEAVGPVKGNLGYLLQYAVSNIVTKNSSSIAGVAVHLWDKFVPWRSSSSRN